MSRVCTSSDTQKNVFQTENYQLPLWQGNSVTSWLTTMNYAMQRIDSVMHDLALRTGVDGLPDEAVEEVVRLSNQMQEVREDLNTIIEDVGNMLITIGNLQTSITDLTTRVQTLTVNTVNLDTRMVTIESRYTDLEARVSKLENNQEVSG